MIEQSELALGKISILMATYNGEKYLTKQIQSLIDQSYTNWSLIIRDDKSSDNTLKIIEGFKRKDKRISLIEDEFGTLKSCQNFSKLMECLTPDSKYIMFCDQDDIWMPEKIQQSIKALKTLESEYGEDQSLMVYGTYKMIDDNDDELSVGVPDYSSVPSLKYLLSQNYVYGCTMLINRSLLEKSVPISRSAENHDYWITLSAVINDAHFYYINEPLILYRQHSLNVSGSYVDAYFINRVKRLFGRTEVTSIQSRLDMYSDIYIRFRSTMSKTNKLLISGYIDKVSKGRLNALFFCLKNGISRRGKIQTIIYYFNLYRTKSL